MKNNKKQISLALAGSIVLSGVAYIAFANQNQYEKTEHEECCELHETMPDTTVSNTSSVPNDQLAQVIIGMNPGFTELDTVTGFMENLVLPICVPLLMEYQAQLYNSVLATLTGVNDRFTTGYVASEALAVVEEALRASIGSNTRLTATPAELFSDVLYQVLGVPNHFSDGGQAESSIQLITAALDNVTADNPCNIINNYAASTSADLVLFRDIA